MRCRHTVRGLDRCMRCRHTVGGGGGGVCGTVVAARASSHHVAVNEPCTYNYSVYHIVQ